MRETPRTMTRVIIPVLREIPRPLSLIIISRSMRIIGAAITTLMYMSMKVSAAFECFSVSSLCSKRRVCALLSKKFGRSPPEVMVVASPLYNSASFLLGLLNAISLNEVNVYCHHFITALSHFGYHFSVFEFCKFSGRAVECNIPQCGDEIIAVNINLIEKLRELLLEIGILFC